MANMNRTLALQICNSFEKIDEASHAHMFFLLVRGADLQRVKELFLSGELFSVHWSFLITDFTGLEEFPREM